MPRERFLKKTDLEKWIKSLAGNLTRPCVVLLDGNLGAGKTQSVRWFVEALGGSDAASPTFAVHHEYRSPRGAIDHVDLYRVKDDADLENSGFWDLLRKDDAMLFVEWASRLGDESWAAHWMQVRLDLRKGEGEEARDVEWSIRRP